MLGALSRQQEAMLLQWPSDCALQRLLTPLSLTLQYCVWTESARITPAHSREDVQCQVAGIRQDMPSQYWHKAGLQNKNANSTSVAAFMSRCAQSMTEL